MTHGHILAWNQPSMQQSRRRPWASRRSSILATCSYPHAIAPAVLCIYFGIGSILQNGFLRRTCLICHRLSVLIAKSSRLEICVYHTKMLAANTNCTLWSIWRREFRTNNRPRFLFFWRTLVGGHAEAAMWNFPQRHGGKGERRREMTGCKGHKVRWGVAQRNGDDCG